MTSASKFLEAEVFLILIQVFIFILCYKSDPIDRKTIREVGNENLYFGKAMNIKSSLKAQKT
jgi:hypothetical protein